MHDQATHNDANAPAPNAAPPANGAAAPLGTDVFKLIADVEGHLTRLRTAQKQQDDAITSLTSRTKALRTGEAELERQRAAFKGQQTQVESDRAALEKDRNQLSDQSRRIEEELRRRATEVEQSAKAIERERSEMTGQFEQARRGAAELEQAKASWQHTRQQMQEQMQRAQAEIEQRQAECARVREEVAAARSQWEKQRQDAQAKLEARAAELEQQLQGLAQRESQMQQERERLSSEQQKTMRQRDELQNRAATLEKERAEVLSRMEQAERAGANLTSQVEKARQDLDEQVKQVKKAMEQITALQKREQTLEHALEEARASAARADQESKELIKLADVERSKVHAKFEASRQDFESAREARDAAIAELENTRKKIAALGRDLKSRDDELAVKDKHVNDLHKKLELAGSKLSEFAQVLSEQTPQLERGASALAMCEEQAEQIDRLTTQLAELQLSSDPAEIQRRDARINELTEALRQSRGQDAGDVAVAQLEQRNAVLEREVQELRLATQNLQISADEARQQLQSRVDSGTGAQMKDVALAEHAAKVAALTAALERQNAASAMELEQRLSAQTQKFQRELATARDSDQSVAKLRQQVADLEAQLAQAKAATANAESSAGADNEYVSKLRARAEQITTVADHLRRRRERLEKMRRLMQAKHEAMPNAGAQGTAQMRAEQAGNVERERQHLMEVRKMLAASEVQMIRRWARQRAAFTMAALAFVVVVSAAATWFGVNYFFPAVRSASVVLEARSRAGSAPLTPEQIAEWTKWHAIMPKDASFQQTFSKRLAERQMKELARPQTIAAKLSREFSVDANQPGMVIYTMAGTDTDQLTAFLDVLTHTVLAEANEDAEHRKDVAVTVATGERKQDGRVCYASLNASPVKDERFDRAVPIFGAALGGLLLLTLVSYIKLSRSKRIFEADNADLFLDTRPASPGTPVA